MQGGTQFGEYGERCPAEVCVNSGEHKFGSLGATRSQATLLTRDYGEPIDHDGNTFYASCEPHCTLALVLRAHCAGQLNTAGIDFIHVDFAASKTRIVPQRVEHAIFNACALATLPCFAHEMTAFSCDE